MGDSSSRSTDEGLSAWRPSRRRYLIGCVLAWAWVLSACSGGSGAGIYVVDAGGSDRRSLGDGGDPAWSPDGARIVFVRDGDLYIVDADGSDLRGLGVGADPSWSPDGTRIAFSRLMPGSAREWIFTMRWDGGERTRLARGAHPLWSPDGSRIAFVSGSSCVICSVRVIDTDGTDRLEYPAGIPGLGQLDALPMSVRRAARRARRDMVDGTVPEIEAAVARFREELSRWPRLAHKLPAGRHEMEVYLEHALDASPAQRDPAWSPNGRSIAFTEGASSIRVERVDRPVAPTRFFHLFGVAVGLTWSPDGRALAFACRRPARTYDLCTVEPDGTDLRTVAEIGYGAVYGPYLSWSPDGTQVAWVGGGLFVIDAMTGARRTIGPDGGGTPAWSPDGTALAVELFS